MSGFVGVCSWTRGSGSRERCIDGRRKFSVARMSIPGASIDENIVDVLRARGLVDAVTHEEIRESCENPVKVYCGFDPTADSLHLGNYIALVTLRWFQLCGHQPVALVGGATGKVGDPSGKSAERPIMSDETIDENLAGISKNIGQVLKPIDGADATTDPVIMNNIDWVGKLSFLDFLREVGIFARVGTMLSKDSVKLRMDSDEGMSFTEFTYQLLQAYDFMYLNERHGVRIQIGGSDQWGNITAGTELARKVNGVSLFGITFPLLTRSDGKKFGKSEGGAIWLSPEKLSPYQLYQYLVKIPDDDVCTFMRRLTFMDLKEIDQIEKSMAEEGYKANTAQKILGEEVTRILHGEEGVKSALAATAVAAPGKAGTAAGSLSADALEAISGDMPNVNLEKENVLGKSVVDVLVNAGLQNSKGEARRLIKNGGGYINNAKVTSAEATVNETDLIEGRLLLLAAGKKSKMLVRVQ
uniref:Tyrosine--tRNA ligase n=1 Tax=Rhodosorus marinus TaxID=101924 RepID=A0A7S3EGP6_9RHOD|mmetsp:Transcript_34556/g.136162  ORF Transcript_34556/g.136162 Transcript_34556/m.136162 type:complete len:470 (+) Transcript_34556:131-1540(+)